MFDVKFLQDVVVDVAKSAAGVYIGSQMGLPGRFDFGDGFVAESVAKGAVNFVTGDLIDLVLSGGTNSKIMNLDVYGVADDVLFYSLVSAATTATNVDGVVYDVLREQVGLSHNNAAILTAAGLLSGCRVASRTVDRLDGVPQHVKNIRYPVRTVMGLI